MRNPDWTFDETVLLLDLYLKGAPRRLTDPGVTNLSKELNEAPTAPAKRLATYRNPVGILMRLRNMAHHDPNYRSAGKGLRAGGRIDRLVWQRFGNRPLALSAKVARIRSAWKLGNRVASPERTTSRRGPPPSFGLRQWLSEDGETQVYVMLLTGPTAAILPNRQIRPGWAVFKIGRSNDVERRCAQLNFGLPPMGALAWRALAVREFPSAEDASRKEIEILDWAAARGWSLGGEFVLAPIQLLRRRLRTPGSGSERNAKVVPSLSAVGDP